MGDCADAVVQLTALLSLMINRLKFGSFQSSNSSAACICIEICLVSAHIAILEGSKKKVTYPSA